MVEVEVGVGNEEIKVEGCEIIFGKLIIMFIGYIRKGTF